jgi:hypothetical protein
MEQTNEGKKCIVCEQERNDMLHILNETVCTVCEQDIAAAKVNDWTYDFYIARLKEIW